MGSRMSTDSNSQSCCREKKSFIVGHRIGEVTLYSDGGRITYRGDFPRGFDPVRLSTDREPDRQAFPIGVVMLDGQTLTIADLCNLLSVIYVLFLFFIATSSKKNDRLLGGMQSQINRLETKFTKHDAGMAIQTNKTNLFGRIDELTQKRGKWCIALNHGFQQASAFFRG